FAVDQGGETRIVVKFIGSGHPGPHRSCSLKNLALHPLVSSSLHTSQRNVVTHRVTSDIFLSVARRDILTRCANNYSQLTFIIHAMIGRRYRDIAIRTS